MGLEAPNGNVRLKPNTPTLLPASVGVGQWWAVQREKFDTTVDIFDASVIKIRTNEK